MRLTCFGIVLVLLMSVFAARTNAQIPERIMFQPGSYAYGMNSAWPSASVPAPMMMQTVLTEVPVEEVEGEKEDDAKKTKWEENFGVKEKGTVLVEKQVPVPGVVVGEENWQMPYLAWHRCPLTHRIHLIPYQPGYVGAEDQFPKHQSRWNLWLSSLPCRTQDRPQVEYLGYYDPMPEVIEDKPSRIQLILGYPNAQWTTCCDNRWGHRMAQCPGVEMPPLGNYAEMGVKDQCCDYPGMHRSIWNGPRPLDYGTMGPPPRQARYPYPQNCDQCRQQPCQYPAVAPAPGPYAGPCPVKAAPQRCCENRCGEDGCENRDDCSKCCNCEPAKVKKACKPQKLRCRTNPPQLCNADDAE